MRVAEVRIDAGLCKGVLINCPLAGKNSRYTIRIIRGTKLRIYKARRSTADTVAALGPGPSNGVAYRDVDGVRDKHIASLPYRHIKNLAARWYATHCRSAVLIHNSEPRGCGFFLLGRAWMFVM
jgi:hypothetical protein